MRFLHVLISTKRFRWASARAAAATQQRSNHQSNHQGELTMTSRTSTLVWMRLMCAGLGACDKTTGVHGTEPKQIDRVAEARIEGP
jgi:hypothetical protein